MSGVKATAMRFLALIAVLVALAQPALSQDSPSPEPATRVMGGYLHQTAITPESYLITSAAESKPFVDMIPPETPYKNLPPPPNPDPFLKGFEVNFEESILAVAVGRNRIENPPIFEGTETLEDGSRLVFFSLSAPTAETYPVGWAVYTGVILPRIEQPTTIVVTSVPAKKKPKWSEGKFERL